MNYQYHINLYERGEFYADVRDPDGNTIHEVKSDEETGEVWQVEDGFMRHIEDLPGLEVYLKSIGVLKPEDGIVGGE